MWGCLKYLIQTNTAKERALCDASLNVIIELNCEMRATVIARFTLSVTELLLPDNHELHLRIQKTALLRRSGTDGRINDSKTKFFLQYGVTKVIYLLTSSSSSEPDAKFQYSNVEDHLKNTMQLHVRD